MYSYYPAAENRRHLEVPVELRRQPPQALQASVNNFFLKGGTRRRTLRGETLGDGGSCRREDIAGGNNTLYLLELRGPYSVWVMGIDS